MNVIKNFFIDETGLQLSEYAVAAGLVALALVVTFANLGRVIELVISALSGNIGTSGIGIE
jgi:Flp pilus assembly pilin Flp